MDTRPFPLTAKYDIDWVRQNSLGENTLYDLESLVEVMDIKKGDRVLDLGCGNAISSIFLANEFGATVWAVDKWVSPTENYKRAEEAECCERVFPLRADVHALPFPYEFFDAAIAIDSYLYFGTANTYLPYIIQFLKPQGLLGIIDTCFKYEIESIAEVPDFLRAGFSEHWYYAHSIEWWRNQWGKTGLVDILVAEEVPQSDFITRDFIETYKDVEEERVIVNALRGDREGFISLMRLVAQRNTTEIYKEPFED